MNQEIESMAAKVGFYGVGQDGLKGLMIKRQLSEFSTLVQINTLNHCIEVCEKRAENWVHDSARMAAQQCVGDLKQLRDSIISAA